MSLAEDPWHWLTCPRLSKGELSRRHDSVVDATPRVAWQVGAQVQREVEGLDPNSKLRPDIQIVFPGQMLLADVVVSHSLTPNTIARGDVMMNAKWQGVKNRKYASVASRVGAEMLHLSVDACGGMASDAVRLVRAIGEEGERCSAGTWSRGWIERMLLSLVAMAVQRGNAMAMLSGYTRSAGAGTSGEGERAGEQSRAGAGRESTD